MTDKLATLQSLRDRVANATGPDREINVAIADAFTPISDRKYWGYGGAEPPNFTSSIDAALAWVERALPDDFVRIEQLTRSRWQVRLEGSEGVSWANAPTPALAIILAGLDALIAKEKTDGTA
jgi:hypothetical protein